jgi:hypothetical protein
MSQILAAVTTRRSRRGERGMNTAEYAVGTGAACGFGGLLYTILTSDFGKNLIEGILDKVTGLLPF